MRKKWFALILLNMIAAMIVMPSVAAEELKTANNQIATNLIQIENKNPYDLNGVVFDLNRTRSSYSLKPHQGSQKIAFTLDLPVPLIIDSSDRGEFDSAVGLQLVPRWKEKNPSGAIGIKYSFSRFEFQHFTKSLVSFFSNMNKSAPRKGSRRNPPVSFYLSLPEF